MNEVKVARPAEKQSPSEKQTLVEEGTEFQGTLSSNCPIVIKGKLKGEVRGPSLHVSAAGSVSGTVKVGEIRSEGELAGRYEADVVRLSGRVSDGTVIRAKSLEIKLAPQNGKMEVTFGECELEVGEQPTAEKTAESPPETGEGAKPLALVPGSWSGGLPGVTPPPAEAGESGNPEDPARSDRKANKSGKDARPSS
jgi:cytoskeletal protein CcmA (bactofilin family)